MFFLDKYHDIRLSERTLKQKLKDFGLKRHKYVDKNVENTAKNIITDEISAGPERLNGCRCGIY